MEPKPTIRIFISSPSDVRPERLIAERVVKRLDKEFAYHFQVEAVLWEREPLVATHHFQDFENIPPPRTTDVTVVILWSRLGVNLPEEKFSGAVSGKAPVTGTEWEFEDALAACRKQGKPDLLLYQKTADVATSLKDRSLLQQRLEQQDKVEAFFASWFKDTSGTEFTAASHVFAEASEFEEKLETHLRAMLRKQVEKPDDDSLPAIVRWHQGSPFRGLLSFEPEHEAIFFGRTRARNEVRELLVRQVERGCAFVLVMGASGSGKSSLVKAGLLPDLTLPGMVGNVALCRHALLRPSDVSGDPIAGLAAAMLGPTALPEMAKLEYTTEILAEQLRENPKQVAFSVKQGLKKASEEAHLTAIAEARLILVVDQLEELFTQDGLTQADRELFVKALEAMARSGLVWVVATMRSDFFDRLDTLPVLASLSGGEARYLLTPPEGAEIGQIIRQPAREAGLRYEIDTAKGISLDEVLRESASGNRDALPLLEFTLEQLWLKKEQNRSGSNLLTFFDYDAMGGLEGAIGQRAEETLSGLSPEAQASFPSVLRALVTVGQGTDAAVTARMARLAQFSTGIPGRRVVDAFLTARLLVADGDGEGARIRVTHEALLTHWERARKQLAEDLQDLQARSRLEQAATHWHEAKEDESLLLAAGLPLSEGEDLLRRRRDELGTEMVSFVEVSAQAYRRSLEEKEAEHQRKIRRTRMVAGVMSVLTVVAGVGAWYGFTGQKVAQNARSHAEELVNFMLFDLRDKLKPLGRSELLGMAANKALDYFKQFDNITGMSLEQQASMAEGLNNLGNVIVDQGNLLGALDVYRKEVEIRRRLVEQSPRNLEYQSNLSHCLNSMGGVLKSQGDLEGALATYQEGMEINNHLINQEPDKIKWQGGLAVSHTNHGRVFEAQGNLTQAEASYRKGLDIRKQLQDQDPKNTNWQEDLAVSYRDIGDVLTAQGDLSGALSAYRDSMEIMKRLAEQDPKNAGWQNNLSTSHDSIGGVLQAQGDLLGALSAYRDSMEIMKRLAEQDPKNAGWQRDFSVSHSRISDVLTAQGDLLGALSAYRDSMEIMKRLVEQDPHNTGWQRDFSVSYRKIGDVLRAQGDLAGALSAYRDSMEITKRLVKQDPRNTVWQHDLPSCHDRIGDVLTAQGDLSGALSAYRDSMEIMKRLAEQDQKNAGWQRDLSVSHSKIGYVLKAQHDRAGALSAYRDSMEIIKPLAEQDPLNAGWQDDLIRAHDRIGDVLLVQGDLAGALSAYRDSMEIRRRLAEQDPRNAGWQRDLSEGHNRIGSVFSSQGDLSGALFAYRDSMEIRRRLAEQDPTNAEWQRDLSVSQEKIGDILMHQGDLSESLFAYQNSMEIRRRLAEQDPTNTEWQDDFLRANAIIGQTIELKGDLLGAVSVFRNMIETIKRLAELNPNYIEPTKAINQWHIYDTIGRLLKLQGDLPGALSAYGHSMEIRKRLAEQEPENARWQTDIAESHDTFGEVLQSNGDLSGALSAYRDSMEIWKRLSEQGTKGGWQEGLSKSQERIGDILNKQGDLSGALSAYRDSMEIIERLAEQNSKHSGWQQYLSKIYNKIGDVLKSQGDLSGALSAYGEKQKKLASAYTNEGWSLIISGDFAIGQQATHKAYDLNPKNLSAIVNFGHTYLLQGDKETAYKLYQEAIPLIQNDTVFEQGPQADFKLFIEKGWKVEECKEAMEWMTREYREYRAKQAGAAAAESSGK